MSAIASNLTLSVVIPAYNEQEVLPEFHRRLAAVMDGIGCAWKAVYVNDGSRDDTLKVLQGMATTDSRIAVLDLSRNFGKEIALTAGLDHADGDAVIVIDADLQDPPEVIPRLVVKWLEGFDVVYARRTSRAGETWLKRLTAWGFYRVMNRMGRNRVQVPQDVGDFRLMSRRAVDAVRSLRERHRFMKGLFAWIGFPQAAVDYERDPRFAGETKWNYWKLWTLALEGLTSHTVAPLAFATYLGLAAAVAAFLFGAYIIAKTLLFGDSVAGYPSLMTVVLFLGGVQLTAIGVLGEYLGRIFNETKGRPLYFVKEFRPGEAAKADAPKRDAASLAG